MKITSNEMTSDLTQHTARATDHGWSVTWLPAGALTQNEAVTAMTIAEVVQAHFGELADVGSRWWLHIGSWAAELGLSARCAVAEASLSHSERFGATYEPRRGTVTIEAAMDGDARAPD